MCVIKTYLLILITIIAVNLVPINASIPLSSRSSIHNLLEINITYNVAVVLFDKDSIDYNSLSKTLTNYTVTSINYTIARISYSFNITWVKAPKWAIDDLVEWFGENYRDFGKPEWVREYEGYTGLKLDVLWIELKKFYNYLTTLVGKITSYNKLYVDDTIVFITDIDGYSRQYYTYSIEHGVWSNNTLYLTGIKGFGGIKPLVFYDLTVVPRKHPKPWQPFYGYGRSVDYINEPPLWSLDNSSIREYILGLVADHLKYHVVRDVHIKPWYTDEMIIELYILCFSNESVSDIVSRLDVGRVVDLVESVDPWIEYRIVVNIVDVSIGYESVLRVVEGSREVSGWIELDANKLLNVFDKLCGREGGCIGGYCREYRYPVYILATDKPSYMSWEGRLNFTAYSSRSHVTVSYPGYMYRVYRSGLNKVIAHEIGHKLGLGHPFQFNNSIRWVMDWIASIMCYDDSVLAGVPYTDTVSYYDREKTALIHTLALLNYTLSKNLVSDRVFNNVVELISRALFSKAFELIHSYVRGFREYLVDYILLSIIPITAIVLLLFTVKVSLGIRKKQST